MKKNGFTLIELLAVIIILAIVALIATPIVLNVIDDARTSAAKSEAAMIVSGVNNYCATAAMKDQLDNTTLSKCIKAEGDDKEITDAELKTMIDLGNASVSEIAYSGGKVTKLVVSSNTKTVTYENGSYVAQ